MRSSRFKQKTKLKIDNNKAVRARALDGFSNVLARLGAGTPNLLEGTDYPPQRLTRNYPLLNSLYREHWIVRRIIDVIPGDMLKNWISLTTEVSPDVLKKIDGTLRKTRLIQDLKEGLQWGRLFGGAIGVILVKGQGDRLAEPMDLGAILPGDFAGLINFDRWNSVNPSMEVVRDISDPEYGLPMYYTIIDPATNHSCRIHHSRVVRYIGNDLPYWESVAEQQWGASAIESIFDELKKRDNVSWNIAQLTFMASLRVLKMSDLGQTLAATDTRTQEELYRTIQAQNWLMSNMALQVIDATDDMQSHQYTFGGISDVYQQFMMDISGAANIPATKLFGRSPSGMNATGESDLQNYYDMIAQEQESKLRPILDKVLPVLCMSTFGAVPDDIDYEFDPVSEPDDKERSELAKSGTENVVSALNAGLVSKRTALKELKQQSERTGVWTNITEEDIMKASDEIEEEGEMMGGMGNMFGGQERIPQPGQNKGTDNGGQDDSARVASEQVANKSQGQGLKNQSLKTKFSNFGVHDTSLFNSYIEDGAWKTVNGAHVYIENEKVIKGANGNIKNLPDKNNEETLNIQGKELPKRLQNRKKKLTKEEAWKQQMGDPIENAGQGIEAINNLRKLKSGYVPAAFTRPDIGDIALPWGDGNMGLSHIIKRRQEQGIAIDGFLNKLPDIIENGELQYDRGRFYIRKSGYTAVVSPTFFDEKINFVLTSWDESVPKNKKAL